jgi:hypothetical protein
MLFQESLSDGLEKLRKYYLQLDEKPSFVLALGELLSHTYFGCGLMDTSSAPSLL